MTTAKRKVQKILFVLVTIGLVFSICNFAVSEIADLKAYCEPSSMDEQEWNELYNKILNGEALSNDDYEAILLQTGLGAPAVDKLVSSNAQEDIQDYYNYYQKEKDFDCAREGVLAYHEYITDKDGNYIKNPPLADLQNGDIIVTLSIHSFGWRHGHAAVVVDAEKGTIVQAVMLGENSALGNVNEFNQFPLVAVLRARDTDETTRRAIGDCASELTGIRYSLLAGIIGNNAELLEATHCAHLVWYAYNEFGIDIDNNGGVVTPRDILKSNKLEIVQVYGSILDM